METVPEGGKFLLVTEAHEKACWGQNNIEIVIIMLSTASALHDDRQLVFLGRKASITFIVSESATRSDC